jgi:hypothetical protein
MSDIDSGLERGEPKTGGRKAKAKAALGKAGETIKHEAQSFAQAAQERARTEAERRTLAGARTLGDFANAIRKAGDELAGQDQSPAARIVRKAADGLESLSRDLADKPPEELLDAVRDFGRRHPGALIGGAVLAGIALGRFVRASEGGGGMTGDFGRPGDKLYPPAETPIYAAGPAATADGAMDLAGAAGTDAEVGAGAEGAIGADLGDLKSSTAEESTSVLGSDAGSGETPTGRSGA